MNEPASAAPSRGVAQGGASADALAQPARAVDPVPLLPGAGDDPGDGVADERPEPLLGYEHL